MGIIFHHFAEKASVKRLLMVELGLPLAMQISITVDLISKKISLYAELTTVETISPVAPSQSENLVHRVTRCKLRPLSIIFFKVPLPI